MKFVRKSRKFRLISRLFITLVNARYFYKSYPSEDPVNPDDVNKIAIFESDRIGDAVWCAPIVTQILNRHPHIDITIITGTNGGKDIFSSLFPALYCIEILLPWQNGNLFLLSAWIKFFTQSLAIKRSKSFDAVFDLRGDIRNIVFLNRFTNSQYYVSNIDAQKCKLLTHCFDYNEATPHMVQAKYTCVKQFLGLSDIILEIPCRQFDNREFTQIIVNPGASEPFRSMNGDEFQSIFAYCRLTNTNLSVLLPPDWDDSIIDFKHLDVNIISMSLAEMFSVFPQNKALYVGMDTGTSHLISMLGQYALIIHRYITGERQISPISKNVKFISAASTKFELSQEHLR